MIFSRKTAHFSKDAEPKCSYSIKYDNAVDKTQKHAWSDKFTNKILIL